MCRTGWTTSRAELRPVNLFRHVAEHRFAAVREVGAGERERAADQAGHVQSGVTAERPPDGGRDAEEQRLDQQDHRHPLVVGDHPPVPVRRDALVKRDVVRVADPAEAVGVVLVRAAEVRRDPAGDRLADVLLRRDDRREHGEDAGRVQVRQAVGDVVVVPGDQRRQTADHRHDPIHPRPATTRRVTHAVSRADQPFSRHIDKRLHLGPVFPQQINLPLI